MSQITIQCRLVASEETRRHLWTLMAQRNTPLINEILTQINQHPDFEQWQIKGKLPNNIVSKLCNTLKNQPSLQGQPSRFYASAIKVANYIYRSWFKLQKRRFNQLQGQQRWLSILKSDTQLLQECQCSLDIIRGKAQAILHKIEKQAQNSAQKSKGNLKEANHGKTLFKLYDQAMEDDTLTRAALCYLLKNGSKLPTQPEQAQKLAQRRRKAEIKITRLKEQLNGSRPHGRDLTGEKWLETLELAANTIPENNALAKSWQDILLTKPQSLPFPITWETNEDLKWSKNEKGRLCVSFSGLGKHTFEIYCSQRQLKWFKRFLEDQQIKRESKNQHSSSLFTLRAAKLVWKEGTGKGEPWHRNHLFLHCTIETRLWSQEGTQQVRKEKIAKYSNHLLAQKPSLSFPLFFRSHQIPAFVGIWQVITSYQILKLLEKGNFKKATQNLHDYIIRLESSLRKINQPYPRPSQPLYQGKSEMILAVAMGLKQPATVAIVNGTSGEAVSPDTVPMAITYRTTKQLLGNHYQLLNRQRQQKQKLSHQRHKAQKRSAPNEFGESQLGLYLDRLLAQAIVQLAQAYQVGTIVVPQLEKIREVVQSELQAKAEQKIPGYLEGQRRYAQQYRINVHQWSYGRLIQNLKAQAAKLGIVIEYGQPFIRGSPQEQAKQLAMRAVSSFS